MREDVRKSKSGNTAAILTCKGSVIEVDYFRLIDHEWLYFGSSEFNPEGYSADVIELAFAKTLEDVEKQEFDSSESMMGMSEGLL